MALTMLSQFIIRGIGCTLIILFVLSVQAINYEDHRHDITPTKLSNIILTNRDLLEQLNLVASKANYTLQKGTERLLYFGAILRMRILDIFGSLLYIHYDDFSIREAKALHKIYQGIFERRYDIFNLVPAILKNSDTRPSKICAEIYAYAEPCLKSSVNICRKIKKQHDILHPDLSTSTLNITYLAYGLSKISKQYLRGFSLTALLKLLQKEVLIITPDLLSGLLYNVRYNSFDDDVRFAERELVQSFHKSARIKILLPIVELKKFRAVNSFLKYYVSIYAERSSDEDLKRHAFLIEKRIVDDVGMINENIYLLGNVYENRTIHTEYLFDLVLPDDLLDNDVIEAKRYLVKKLNEFDVAEKYLRVQKYQQATPAQLTMEITGQLRDIDFVKSIATSLRIHARFWRSNRMIESLDELLELFDAYENLRQVPHYDDMMRKIDNIKKYLWDMKDIPVEILCNAPRACLRIGLQSILHCKYMSSEIKELIKDFLKTSNMCIYLTQTISRHLMNIPFKISKTRFSTQLANINSTWNSTLKGKEIKLTSTTTRPSIIKNYGEDENTESSESEETTEFDKISNESTEVSSTKPETSSEESTEFINTTMITLKTIEYMEPISTMTTMDTSTVQEETATAAKSTTVATTTSSPTTTTTLSTTLPTTSNTTTISPQIITTTLPSISSTTTILSKTTTALPTMTTTETPATITTALPTTSTLSTMTTAPSARTITELPIANIEMELEYSKKNINILYDDEVTQSSLSVITSTSKSCESNECSSKKSSEEIGEETTTQTFLESIRTTSPKTSTTNQNFSIAETTVTSTSETPVTKEGCRSKNESIETPGSSCETNCESTVENCDEEESALEDIFEKVETHTAKCSKVRCGENFSEISSECETKTDKSCECVSKKEKNAECITSCSSKSSSCEEKQNDCSKLQVPTVSMKFKSQRRGICEIRDPHHRRQMRRLAKMRAISTVVATPNTDTLRLKASRHRIVNKKVYNLLADKLSSVNDRNSSRIAEYLLRKPLSKMNRIEGANRKRREQKLTGEGRRKNSTEN